ncbi:MAG: hypothetical protein ABW189_06720 [Rickettsiales bacterium]
MTPLLYHLLSFPAREVVWRIASAQEEDEIYPALDALRLHAEEAARMESTLLAQRTVEMRAFAWAHDAHMAIVKMCRCVVSAHGDEIVGARQGYIYDRRFVDVTGRADMIALAVAATEALLVVGRRLNARAQKNAEISNADKVYYKSCFAHWVRRHCDAFPLPPEGCPATRVALAPRARIVRRKTPNAVFLGVRRGRNVYFNAEFLARRLFHSVGGDPLRWGQPINCGKRDFLAMAKAAAASMVEAVGIED